MLKPPPDIRVTKERLRTLNFYQRLAFMATCVVRTGAIHKHLNPADTQLSKVAEATFVAAERGAIPASVLTWYRPLSALQRDYLDRDQRVAAVSINPVLHACTELIELRTVGIAPAADMSMAWRSVRYLGRLVDQTLVRQGRPRQAEGEEESWLQQLIETLSTAEAPFLRTSSATPRWATSYWTLESA